MERRSLKTTYLSLEKIEKWFGYMQDHAMKGRTDYLVEDLDTIQGCAVREGGGGGKSNS